MDRLLKLLLDNPIIGMVAFFWIVGAIGNVRAAQKKREQAARGAGGMPPVPPPAPRRDPTDNTEQVAREMRRILGLEPEVPSPRPQPKPVQRTQSKPPSKPQPRPVISPPRRSIERAPLPAAAGAQARNLDVDISSHVGATMAQRRSGTSAELGSLGGRVHDAHHAGDRGSRFAVTDLKRVLVLGEILGPPMALREPGQRLI